MKREQRVHVTFPRLSQLPSVKSVIARASQTEGGQAGRGRERQRERERVQRGGEWLSSSALHSNADETVALKKGLKSTS